MSANFVQVSGPGGRTQTLVPGTSIQTYIWNPASLRGSLPGGDFIYADRVRFHVVGQLTRAGLAGTLPTPNWEALAQAFGQIRIYSQILGEVGNKSQNSVPIIQNHDAMFANGFGPPTRIRGQLSGSSGDQKTIEYEFEWNFKRSYLTRPTDSCPWLPLFEGGIFEVDLMPSTALASYGWTMSGNWVMDCNIDWFPDKQAIIHTPVQPRLYRVTTAGPEFLIKGVGAPAGLDGVVQGSRLAVLSWLGAGASHFSGAHDNGFYAAFGGSGGILFGTAGLSRIDIPFRDQVSIDNVSCIMASFLAELAPVRFRNNIPAGQVNGVAQTDLAGWPYCLDPSLTDGLQSLVNDALDFWGLVWPGPFDKISDVQKVNGDLSFTVNLTTPGSPALHLFRSDEIGGFTVAKVLDLMDRMGLPHKDRGGRYTFVPKYAGNSRADDSTQWGMPLKIVMAAA